MERWTRQNVAPVLAGAVFSITAAGLFALGDEREGSLLFFLAWLGAHIAYGVAAGSFWALAVVLACPPLLVAAGLDRVDETPLWLQSASAELFYGVPFAFMGIVACRLWQARRQQRLMADPPGEDSAG